MKNPTNQTPIKNIPSLFWSFASLGGIILSIMVLLGCSSNSAPPEEINLLRNKAADFTKFGNQYYDQAQFDQALSFFKLALQNNILIDNQFGTAESFNSLGKAQMALDQVREAEQSFLEAQNIALSTGSLELQLRSTNNLSEIKIRSGQVDQALEDLLSAVKKNSNLQSREMAVLYSTLGAAYRKKGQSSQETGGGSETSDFYSLALSQFEKAANINQGLKLYQELASNYYMSATVLARQKQWDKATDMGLKALENDKKMENSLGIAQDLRLIGEISLLRGDTKEAFNYQFRAYRIFQALQMTTQEIKSVEKIIPLLETLGLTDQAQVYKVVRQNLLEKAPVNAPK